MMMALPFCAPPTSSIALEVVSVNSSILARVPGPADFEAIEEALAATIARGQADGSLSRTPGARETAQLLVVAFAGFQVMVRTGGDTRARLEGALRRLLDGLD